MPFDPQVQAIHDRVKRERVPNLYTLSIADARLADAGVPVEVSLYDGMPHAFFTMIGVLDVARLRESFAAP